MTIEESPEERITKCECGADIRYIPLILDGAERFKPSVCDMCDERQRIEKDADDAKAKIAARQSDWEAICPPLYRDTDLHRLPSHYLSAIEAWRVSSTRAPAFIGPAGECKTRAAFEILRRNHFSGVGVAAISATRFAKVAAEQFDNDFKVRGECRGTLDRIHKVRLLLLDDLGKQKMSDRAEVELFDLLEYRTSNLLPTIWTANASGDELLAMFSEDRGDPILRRLAEFSEVVSQRRKAA